MWSERYDRELKDIFKLQDEIAIEIAKAMQIKITEGEIIQTRLDSIPDLDVPTYFKYLKANQYFRQFTKEGAILARKELEELLALKPEVSEFYSLLGFCYWWEIALGRCQSDLICFGKAFGKATEAARKALSLDPNSSDAHSIASALFGMRKEHDKAITESKMAIMLNPNNADAYCVFGAVLILSGRPEEAIGVLKNANRLNPIPPVLYLSNLAWAYRVSKRYDKAIEMFGECVRRQPDYLHGYLGLALSYHLSGREEEAKTAVKEILNINPDYSIELYKKTFAFKDRAEIELAVKALRKAGLPE
jgi:tetratricopeptide (TPR) repeat protein